MVAAEDANLMKTSTSGQATTRSLQACSDGVCTLNNEPLIEAKNLSIRYGNKAVLDQVSLRVDACSIMALIGPSGCGKTSFLNCINRLTDMIPSCRVTGSLKLGAIDVLDPKTNVLALRRQVGMVFQKPNPFPLSIWKNIALPLKQYGIKGPQQVEAQIEAVLQEVGLWHEVKDRLHRPALALSGGQQQRLCIARTLALKPNVVLFDEPCSALDPMATQVIEDLIKKLRKNYAVVIVTHNLAQARRIADHVGVFWVKNGVGQLLEYGAANQVFGNPSHKQTTVYLSGGMG